MHIVPIQACKLFYNNAPVNMHTMRYHVHQMHSEGEVCPPAEGRGRRVNFVKENYDEKCSSMTFFPWQGRDVDEEMYVLFLRRDENVEC